MSLIIDANKAHEFVRSKLAHHAKEIVIRISKKKVYVAVGGRALRELMDTSIRQLISEWERSGRLVRASDEVVNQEEKRWSRAGLKSNDPHIIALAFVSGARLLYTDDELLVDDFKSCLRKPKGRVITTRTRMCTALNLLERLGG